MKLKSLSMAASACFVISITHGQTPETPPAAPTPPIDRIAGIAIEDMRIALQTRFDRMDTNGDGYLTEDEFSNRGPTAANRRAAGEGVGRAGDRPRAGAGERRPQRQGRMPIRWRSFDEYDSNQDGQVSPDEMSAPIEELVSLDTNGDGRLDRREMRVARQPSDAGKKAPKNAQ